MILNSEANVKNVIIEVAAIPKNFMNYGRLMKFLLKSHRKTDWNKKAFVLYS